MTAGYLIHVITPPYAVSLASCRHSQPFILPCSAPFTLPSFTKLWRLVPVMRLLLPLSSLPSPLPIVPSPPLVPYPSPPFPDLCLSYFCVIPPFPYIFYSLSTSLFFLLSISLLFLPPPISLPLLLLLFPSPTPLSPLPTLFSFCLHHSILTLSISPIPYITSTLPCFSLHSPNFSPFLLLLSPYYPSLSLLSPLPFPRSHSKSFTSPFPSPPLSLLPLHLPCLP